ncbi:MAG TPA: aspartate carbamoyltransferase catalytic subunit [Acidimicrobiia bacterium]|nr:aspartate carbamoyltransferase catalytic subunit [Acidimicrobiia bacterium]
MSGMAQHGLISLRGMDRAHLEALLDRAQSHVGSPVSSDLAGATVTTAFFEPSTRTRLSFERAAHRLGAHVMDLSPDLSSTVKGESFKDTILTLTAIGTDLFVIRHWLADAAELAAEWSRRPVINAGVGRREHPTQTLIDALTLRQEFGHLDGLRMAIVGDIRNSRVARGHLEVFPTLGMELTLVGPTPFLPSDNPWGVRVSTDLDDELGDVDVVYLLRIQTERGASDGIPADGGHARRYGMNVERMSMLKPAAVIMHPGPINRGVEIDDVAADGERSLILEQVANGVPVRMAVISEALGGSG